MAKKRNQPKRAKRKETSVSKSAAPLRGKALLAAAVNKILAHPDQWKQSQWHCGTSHCVGGWCQILAGLPQSDRVETEAPALIGLSSEDAGWLFSPNRSLPQIHAFANDFINDRAGFDRAGFDRAGFDRAGFDRDGFDRAGFDRDGFDRDGFDRDGKQLSMLTVPAV